jgi:hypothetical protein
MAVVGATSAVIGLRLQRRIATARAVINHGKVGIRLLCRFIVTVSGYTVVVEDLYGGMCFGKNMEKFSYEGSVCGQMP